MTKSVKFAVVTCVLFALCQIAAAAPIVNAGVTVQDAANNDFSKMDPPANAGEKLRLKALAECICEIIHGDPTAVPPKPHCMPEDLQKIAAMAKAAKRLNVATKAAALKFVTAQAVAAGIPPSAAGRVARGVIRGASALTSVKNKSTFFMDDLSSWTKWWKKAAVVDETGALESLLPAMTGANGMGFSSGDSYPAATRKALKAAMSTYAELREANQTLAYLLGHAGSISDPNEAADHADSLSKMAKYVKSLRKTLCEEMEDPAIDGLPSTDRHKAAMEHCKSTGFFLMDHACIAITTFGGGNRWR